MSHTPGPWKFEDEYVRDATGEIIADPYTRPTADAGDEMEANAKLIAAAPDMLATLETLVATVDENDDFDSDDTGELLNYVMVQCRAIVEIATGKRAPAASSEI
jgi:hypothetical protein